MGKVHEKEQAQGWFSAELQRDPLPPMLAFEQA